MVAVNKLLSYGLVTMIQVPGAGLMQLYQPKHAIAGHCIDASDGGRPRRRLRVEPRRRGDQRRLRV